MAVPQKTSKPFHWVIISAAGFIIFMGMAILFSIYSDKLNLINSTTYFFLLIPLALAAAGFLFGALRSHAKYSGKAPGGTLELSGPVVVLALIVWMGFKFRPSEQAFSTTINVFSAGEDHTPVEDGKLIIYYGAAHVSKKITDGQVVVNEIPRSFRGKEIKLVPTAEGYAAKTIQMVLPTDENVLNIYLEKSTDSVNISGIVLTPAGKAVQEATIIFADGLAKTETDAYGNFRLSLPLKDGSETHVRVYKNDEMLYNNLLRISRQVPVTIQTNEP